MFEIAIATPSDPVYGTISAFAKAVYDKKLHAQIQGNPDVFSYAYTEDGLLGCFGLYAASAHNPLLLETYFSGGILRRLGNGEADDRTFFGEMGTRAVQIPEDCPIGSGMVSLALSAMLIIAAERQGIRYLGFTANKGVRALARGLDTELRDLGEPDLSLKDERFRENWKHFLQIEQRCYGITVAQSIPGCRRMLARLRSEETVAA